MYLHLGSDFVIKNTDIIAIFNIRNQKNNVFKNYLQKQCEKHKYEVIDLSENGEYSSCILTDDKIYLSGISALTLKKRAEDNFGIEVYNRDRDN